MRMCALVGGVAQVQYAFTSVGYDHRKINAKSKSDLHTRAKALASGKFGAAFKVRRAAVFRLWVMIRP